MARLSIPSVLALDALPPPVRRALERVAALAAPAWLVGGALRDALLGETVAEVDIAVPGRALALGRALADSVPWSSFVALDADRGTCRVLAEVQIDIAVLRADTLAGDLAGRDFTVNALAVSLAELVGEGRAPILDTTGGLGDLERRIVRLCAPGAIADDPVRALRAARLAIRPGFALDAAAESAIRAAASRVAGVSAERVRDELASILGAPAGGAGLRLLDRVGVLPVILPESLPMKTAQQSEPHRFDVWEHSLRAVDAADLVLGDLASLGAAAAGLAAHLAEPLGDGLARREVLKLAALLHDVAKPETRRVRDGRARFIGHDVLGAERAGAIAERWRLSGRAGSVLRRLVGHHLRPMHLAIAGGVTRRARYRFFRDLGEEAFDLLLLALADAAAVKGEAPAAVWAGPGGSILRQLMEGAGEETRAAQAPRLITGEDVMAAFGLPPGPEVGRLLARAREAQALGLASTRAEALDLLRRPPGRALDTPEHGP